MLVFGQVLNTLAPLSLYVLGARWTGRAVGGLAAMVVAGTISLMPAYYVTWGRYTQLEGLVILPLAMLVFDSALQRSQNRWLLIAAVLAAGLFLVHYRVVVFYATYVLSMLLWQTLRLLRRHEPARTVWLRAAAIAALALMLSAPWLWRVLTTAVFPLDSFTARFYSAREGNPIPFDLLSIGTMPALLVAAGLGALAALWLGKRNAPIVIVVLLWMGLTALVHNPSWLGLPSLWILENFSAVIALFVPLSLLIGLGVSSLVEFTAARFSLSPTTLEAVATALLLLIAIAASPNMAHIVNPVTVIAEPDDLTAMDWIRANVPADVKFLVNERLWLAPIYAGTDAGYWIPNLTGRRTTMPVVFYVLGSSAAWKDSVNVLAHLIESGPEPDNPSFLSLLRSNDVTYLYLGVRGGPLSLEKFAASVHFHEVYSRNAVHIFAIEY
jgi:hypothetical protein